MPCYRLGTHAAGFLGQTHERPWTYILAENAAQAWALARKLWFDMRGPGSGQFLVSLDEEKFFEGVVCVSGDRAVLSPQDRQTESKSWVRVATGPMTLGLVEMGGSSSPI